MYGSITNIGKQLIKAPTVTLLILFDSLQHCIKQKIMYRFLVGKNAYQEAV